MIKYCMVVLEVFIYIVFFVVEMSPCHLVALGVPSSAIRPAPPFPSPALTAQ